METYLEFPVDGHANEGQAEEARPTIGDVLIVLRQLLEVKDERWYTWVVIVSKAILNILLDYARGSQPLLSGSLL